MPPWQLSTGKVALLPSPPGEGYCPPSPTALLKPNTVNSTQLQTPSTTPQLPSTPKHLPPPQLPSTTASLPTPVNYQHHRPPRNSRVHLNPYLPHNSPKLRPPFQLHSTPNTIDHPSTPTSLPTPLNSHFPSNSSQLPSHLPECPSAESHLSKTLQLSPSFVPLYVRIYPP